MGKPKSKGSVGLGNTLMKDRFGKGKGTDRRKVSAVTRINHATGEEYLVNDREEAAWVKMRSVTEQGALDEFLATAELADTNFTAEKLSSVKIIHTDNKNPYLLSATEERNVLDKHKKHQASLTVPRRPHWDKNTTPEELDRAEKAAFLNWRRGLAEVSENNDLLLTPFERNLEVWRQLWRVIERSDIVVQIVDARNPILFRSDDLDHYVKDIDSKKENLLLINKADMMTDNQRRIWVRYLKEQGIAYQFFSAQLAKKALEADELAQKPKQVSSDDEQDEEREEEDKEKEESGESSTATTAEKPAKYSAIKTGSEVTLTTAPETETASPEPAEKEEVVTDEEDIRILTVWELEEMLLRYAPKGLDRKLQVGLVGYPNVGKSSTINALAGSKKVSVSSTPGKTKHFQTIHLSESIVLCDCPGLVFPNFAFTKGDLVCNGVLPIDQLREYTGPVTLVTQRIPQAFLEAIYGITIKTRPVEEGGTGVPTASELLSAYARARGFQTQGLGQPDESRAARYILKDYVNGKLLFCHPPPNTIDPTEFNRELYDDLHLPERRRAALAAQFGDLSIADTNSVSLAAKGSLNQSKKAEKLDKGFFDNNKFGVRVERPFHFAATEQGKEAMVMNQMSARQARAAGLTGAGLTKKHFKGNGKGGKAKKRQNYNDED